MKLNHFKTNTEKSKGIIMSITKEFDTITAISTPLGEGAIGIVRLSGTDALRYC